MTEVVVTACTVVAYSALHTDISVSAVLAVFAAIGTDVGTLRAARTAGTDNVHAILTKLTFLAVVALAAYTVKAGPAVEAKLVARALRAFLIAFLTAKGTFGAAVAAVADPVGAFDTDVTVGAVCFITYAIGAFFTFAADPVTARALLAALLTDGLAHLVASAAFVLALTAFEAKFAVVAQTVVFHTLTA